MSVTIDGREYSWTQAICVACWNARPENARRRAVPETGSDRFVAGGVCRCCYCGGGTTSGIFVRADPRTVPFPQREAELTDPPDQVLPMADALALELSEAAGHAAVPAT